MSYRIVVYGEGEHEFFSKLDVELSDDRLPALPQLVHRLLESPSETTYTCKKFKDVRHVHAHRPKFTEKAISKFTWKVHSAMRQVKKDGDFTAVIIVIDRDKDKERIDALRQGRNWAAETTDIPCAVAAAVETFDAWMITDANAVKKSGGDQDKCCTEPEKLDRKFKAGNHPKKVALKIFSNEEGLREKYAAVAEKVNLKLLIKNCPKGFKPFAQEVESIIRPAISS